MKKTAKIILTVCCAVLILFLLLPFLETQAPQQPGQTPAAKAEPQIFTSNPLTDLVKRIARFFGARGSDSSQPKAQILTAAQADAAFGTPQDGPLYAAANGSEIQTQETPAALAGGTSYANAYLQNDEGEWVLIRQTAPEGGTRGMHEVNVKDNAYDRYVHEERQARFTPVMRTPKSNKEVPDSALARLFNPIKHFFGFGTTPAASGSLQADLSTDAAGRLASADGLGKNKEKQARSLPRAQAGGWNWAGINPVSSAEPGSAEAALEFLKLINPREEVEDVARWLADIKYPNANDPDQQAQKENFQKNRTAEGNQQVILELQEKMVRKAAGKEQTNLLQNMFDCKGKTSSVARDSCSASPDSQEEKENPAAIKDQSLQYFTEKTGLPLPPAGISVILHRTDLKLPGNNWVADDPATQQTLEWYKFQQKNCGNCYWVATGAENAPDLQQTIEAAGLQLKGDPLNRYDSQLQAYLENLRQKGEKTEEEIQQIGEQLQENKAPFTAYTEQDLRTLYQNTRDLFSKRARPEQGSVPFFTHVENANQFYQNSGGQYPLLYGQGSATNGNIPLKERAEKLTDEIADYVLEVREARQNVERDAIQEGTAAQVAPVVQRIQQQLQQDINSFNQNNTLGHTEK